MAQKYTAISDKHRQFILEQKVYFVGTAMAQGHINVSPKGMDSLRVLDANRVLWLSVTGSGNESSAHVQNDSRMTVMFCSFTGPPMIMRLYGTALVIHKGDAAWPQLFSLFPPLPGARQIFDLKVDLLQTSCGMAVPLMDHVEDRSLLNDWAARRGDDGLRTYWEEKNQLSLDGIPTHIMAKSQ